MIKPEHDGMPLIPTHSAMKEMFDLGMDMFDISDILEEGYDCSRSRRKKNTLERCVDKGGKTLKVVVVKSYNHSLQTDVWAITHVGMFTKRR